MKNLEGMEWKSRDQSSQECIADKAGLPPNNTNLEKYVCANFVSVHIPNYFLKYNLPAVIVWRESRVVDHFLAGCVGEHVLFYFLNSECFWRQ